ncbi:MAG: DUF5317 family protein [Pelotomaculum sp.]|jgi:uncharacterized SAM-binding protein YcdF (DUF218 family)
MAFFIIVIGAVAAVALLTGGSLSRIKELRFKHTWLVLVAVGLKIITGSSLRYTFHIADPLAPKLYMLSLALVALFVLLNLRLRGFAFIGLGLLGNLLAIFANGGHMPIKEEYFLLAASAEELARVEQGLAAFNYIPAGPDTKFYFLADIFAIPNVVVYSVGDIFIVLGGCIFVWCLLKDRTKSYFLKNMYY